MCYQPIPTYWRELDYIAEFSDQTFKEFLEKYFSYEYYSKDPINMSMNKGYEYYRSNGEISNEINKMHINSGFMHIYKEIQKANTRT